MVKTQPFQKFSYHPDNLPQQLNAGQGSFGSVFECKVKLDDRPCAIKKIHSVKLEEEDQSLINEVRMLSLAQHPNVVGYHQAWTEDYREPSNLYSYNSGSSSYCRTEKMMYVHMELCKGYVLILTDSQVLFYFSLRVESCMSNTHKILEALQFIHGKDIIHRDLKPDNIFIDDSGTVKIGDFGLALQMDVSSTTNSLPVGAYLYRAPEMKKGVPTYKPTNKVDMYALGLILFQLFCPRQCSERKMLKLRDSPEPVCEKYKVDETAKHLILELLQTDPLKRPSAADLLRRLDGLEVDILDSCISI
ncbi:unnamed protein product [Coffea canephora]|uniref:Protein kinase domain-containing protein n=1 Tax=Coffea canephora TaxID=49390 RepID=A0A068U8K2_COFCA|nr:unnamed protein product [Coffea canephora]